MTTDNNLESGRSNGADVEHCGRGRDAGDAEDVGGHDSGAQGYVVGAVVPLVVDAGEEIFDVEVFVVADAELFEVEVDPSGLLVVGIEVDGDEDHSGGSGTSRCAGTPRCRAWREDFRQARKRGRRCSNSRPAWWRG